MVCTVAMNTLLPDGFGQLSELKHVIRPLSDNDNRRTLLLRRVKEALDRFSVADDSLVGHSISAADLLEALVGILALDHQLDRSAALHQITAQLGRKYERLGGFEPGVVFEA